MRIGLMSVKNDRNCGGFTRGTHHQSDVINLSERPSPAFINNGNTTTTSGLRVSNPPA